MTRFHTTVTERGGFRDCRRRWWYTTQERLQPKSAAALQLEFGNDMHEALDVYYRGGRELAPAIRTFEWEWERTDAELEVRYGPFYQYIREEWQDHRQLGVDMLTYYDQFDRENGFFAEVKEVAIEERAFVDILHPSMRTSLPGHPLLSGKIDLVVEARNGGIWVVDHKTFDKQASESALEVDDQLTAYCYIYWRLSGVIPDGAMYNVLVKHPPRPPKTLKSGKVSVDKRQRTTWQLFQETAREHDLSGLVAGDYADYVDMLQRRGWTPFFQRIGTRRTEQELLAFERRLYAEYRDMENATENEDMRYPNPSNRLCRHCPVLPICHAHETGDDVQYIVENGYVTTPPRVTIPEGV